MRVVTLTSRQQQGRARRPESVRLISLEGSKVRPGNGRIPPDRECYSRAYHHVSLGYTFNSVSYAIRRACGSRAKRLSQIFTIFSRARNIYSPLKRNPARGRLTIISRAQTKQRDREIIKDRLLHCSARSRSTVLISGNPIVSFILCYTQEVSPFYSAFIRIRILTSVSFSRETYCADEITARDSAIRIFSAQYTRKIL